MKRYQNHGSSIDNEDWASTFNGAVAILDAILDFSLNQSSHDISDGFNMILDP